MNWLISKRISAGIGSLLLTAVSGFGQDPAAGAEFKPVISSGTVCTTTFQYPSIERRKQAGKSVTPTPLLLKRALSVYPKGAAQVSNYTDQEEIFRTYRGHFILTESSLQGPSIVQIGSEDDPGDPDFRRNPFPELDWVDGSDFKGSRKFNGREFLIFEETDKIPALSKRLLVDSLTGLPQSLQTYHLVAQYSYRPDPEVVGQKSPLPPRLQQAWQKMKADTKRYLKVEIEE